MCRSIKVLHRADPPPTREEVREAALQFVRKISGYRTPSQANEDAFDSAVEEVASASLKLLRSLGPRRTPAARRPPAMIPPLESGTVEPGR